MTILVTKTRVGISAWHKLRFGDEEAQEVTASTQNPLHRRAGDHICQMLDLHTALKCNMQSCDLVTTCRFGNAMCLKHCNLSRPSKHARLLAEVRSQHMCNDVEVSRLGV